MEPALRRISLAALQTALQEAAQIDKMVKWPARQGIFRRCLGCTVATGPETGPRPLI